VDREELRSPEAPSSVVEEGFAKERQGLLRPCRSCRSDVPGTLCPTRSQWAAHKTYSPKLEQEPHLKRELGFTVLDVADEFMLDFHFELKDQNKEHMVIAPTLVSPLAVCALNQPSSGLTILSLSLSQECLFRALGLLLQGESSVSLLGSLFSTLRYFINTYPQTLFRWANTSYCGDLCFEVLRHCNVPHAAVRAKAAALFYLLIKARTLCSDPPSDVAVLIVRSCHVVRADQLRGDKVDRTDPAAVHDCRIAAHRYGEGVRVPHRVASRRNELHQARRPQQSPSGRDGESVQAAPRGMHTHTHTHSDPVMR
jgi:hypothetical protein